tara:strand:+ start:1334 stop:2248 length:915 start_codon:yes stop_codon:yes gene_type:complete
MAIYYINGTTLSNSTAVFTDAALTTCAPDGFYSDGSGISRNQDTCVLGPIQNCPECLTGCDTGSIVANSGQGTFLLDLDLGDTASDVGAVIIKFTPASVPDGIRATYNGASYNKLSSDVDGLHEGSVSGGYTYVGNSGASCVPVAGTTYSGLAIYRYNGSSFADTGTTQDVAVQAGELSFSATTPGNLYMVIPKIASTPKTLNIEMAGVCAGTVFAVEVSCPQLLPGYVSSSSPSVNSVDACGIVPDTNYYSAQVAGSPGVPEIFDFVFSDAYGQYPLGDGFFNTTGALWIEVSNGIVINKAAC